MRPRFLSAILLIMLSACAERSIYIYNAENEIIGECMAGYDWHLYGIQDSIDYILHKCAKEHVAKGRRISDPGLFEKDFTLPVPPADKPWTKNLAMAEFHAGRIDERRLGYVLAEVEYQHIMRRRDAEARLANGKIDDAEFLRLMKASELTWKGE